MTQPTSRISRIKILIAEHTLSVADAIARNLKSEGYAIAGIVTSCEQTLEYATLTVPDLVLLEIPLPGEIDSLTVGRKIRQDLNCPVVYMIASTHPKEIAWVRRANPHECLVKPFTAEALKRALKQALQHHQTQLANAQDNYSPTQSNQLESNTTQQSFLGFLSAASTLQPMPRVLFAEQVLKVYTGTLESAFYLSLLCQQQAYAYQIFILQPQDATFQLFDESDQNYTDLQDLI